MGPDEPRYAAVARTMAETGDWVTPRLDGEPWFEKPALLYWLGAAAIAFGAPPDQATRLAVSLVAGAFLLYFWVRLRRLFNEDVADSSALVLAVSVGWVAFAQVGVFDLPLAAALGAALLSLGRWIEDERETAGLPWFGGFLGLSVLAKGLVGPALAALALLPIAFERGVGGAARALFHPRALLPFLLVALPWYVACYAANGAAFLEEFFWEQHVERLYSAELQHVQPFWFYGPVLIAALLPWTPLLASLRGRDLGGDRRARFLTAWAVGTLLLFSLATNKLPGYLLPALPALAVLLGRRLARPPVPRIALAASAATLALLPAAAAVLPDALAVGLPRAWPPESMDWTWTLCALVGVGVASAFASRGRSKAAAAAVALAAVVGFTLLAHAVFPAVDRIAGSRTFWREQIAPHASVTCLGDVRRHLRYGLAFYAESALPNCSEAPRARRVVGDPPRIVREAP